MFVHPLQDGGVMAGNGTTGLKMLKDLPNPDAVVVGHSGAG